MNAGSFNTEVIRYTVHSFYTQRQYPTLSTVPAKLKEDDFLEVIGIGVSRPLKVLGLINYSSLLISCY